MNKVKFVLFSAGILLALAFTFGCSSGSSSGGDDPDNGGNGQGGSFNENSQIYYDDLGDDNRDFSLINSAYKGNGIIEVLEHIRIGSVTNGIVYLELDKVVPADEYLGDFFDDDDETQRSCASYPKGIKILYGDFVLTSNNGDDYYQLRIFYWDEQIEESIDYFYFSEAGKITCNFNENNRNKIYNIDARKGWNKIYHHRTYSKNGRTDEYSTNNILKKERELKWLIW